MLNNGKKKCCAVPPFVTLESSRKRMENGTWTCHRILRTQLQPVGMLFWMPRPIKQWMWCDVCVCVYVVCLYVCVCKAILETLTTTSCQNSFSQSTYRLHSETPLALVVHFAKNPLFCHGLLSSFCAGLVLWYRKQIHQNAFPAA